MKIAKLSLLAAVFAAGAMSSSALAEGSCHLRPVTTVPMTMEGDGRVSVPMKVGGKIVNLVVDTGGVDSMLTDRVVDSLKLQRRRIRNMRVTMFGGRPITEFVHADNVEFGGLKASYLDFLVMPYGMSSSIDGFLAPDIMRAYDDEFDFANARFSLFDQNHCPGQVVYWTKSRYAEIDIDTDRVGHIRIPVTLDGVKVDAAIDTGAGRSVMDLDTAESDFDFDEKNPALKPIPTDGQEHAYRYPFKTLSFNGVTVYNPDLVLVSREFAGRTLAGRNPQMILGMEILRHLHLYIAYGEKKLYVTSADAH